MSIAKHMIRSRLSKEIILRIHTLPILITTCRDVFFIHHVIVSMIFLIPLQFPLFAFFLLSALLLLPRHPLDFPFLSYVFFSFRMEIRKFLFLCLVESVDDRILADRNENLLCELRVMEGNLSGSHGGILSQVGPRCVNDCNVVLFITWQTVGKFVQSFGQS